VEATTDKRGEIVLAAFGSSRRHPIRSHVRRTLRRLGAIRVPGSWGNGGGWQSIVTRGTDASWKTYDGDKVSRAWYERTVTMPTEWRGRSVILDVGRVSTDADVFVDGRPAGRVTWPYGTVDLTEFLTPGKAHTLALRVAAATDAKEVLNFMETASAQVSTTAATLDTRGITGDVVLRSRPKGALSTGFSSAPASAGRNWRSRWKSRGWRRRDRWR
jgi:beta-galactosidase